MKITATTKYNIDRIKNYHNPDFDVPQVDGMPNVPWYSAYNAESIAELVTVAEDQAASIAALQTRVEELEAKLNQTAAAKLGGITSEAKARASRKNGLKGGRPRKAHHAGAQVEAD